jgi:serine/threonine protein kinase
MKVLAEKQLASKKFTYQDKNFENEFKREAQLLKNLNHPHIIKMVNASPFDDESEA